ncbi:hypothetical protein [Streptomyces nitrosporeus]|uniref:hypothetical protein n=1 Tax=Streptomyces nitrosporeus TaxID=28894 RepID=UPI00399F98B1
MLRHVIAPSRRYTKASHDVTRHPRLTSDAKILLLHVQGLPEDRADGPLGEHAREVGITGRAYQKAKELLVMNGFLREKQVQGSRGHWTTTQLLSNVPLTPQEAVALQDARACEPSPAPSAQAPTAGRPRGRVAGGQLPVEEEREKNSSHPPTEEAAAEAADEAAEEAAPALASVTTPTPASAAGTGSEAGSEPGAGAGAAPEHAPVEAQVPDWAAQSPDGAAQSPEVAEAERVLLSLRHVCQELRLGAKDARALAGPAAAWLLRGITPTQLRKALGSALLKDGVRYAPGFLWYRLVHEMPEEPEASRPRMPEGRAGVAALVPCAGPGGEHLFRPAGDEDMCGGWRREAAYEHWLRQRALAEEQAGPRPWRERFAAVNGPEPDSPVTQEFGPERRRGVADSGVAGCSQ